MAKKPVSAKTKAVEATTLPPAVKEQAAKPAPSVEPAALEPEQPVSLPPVEPVIPSASEPVETVAAEDTSIPEVAAVENAPIPEVVAAIDDVPASIIEAELPPAKKQEAVAVPFGILDHLKGRELAGWVRISGDPAAVEVVLLRDFRELKIPIVQSSSAENIWLFNVNLPVALTARELLAGQAAVVARCDGQEYKFGLWDPIRIAGEISGYDLTMLSRLRYALPRGILGSLTRDPSLDDR